MNALRPVDRIVALYNLGAALAWTSVAASRAPGSTGAGLALSVDSRTAGLLAVAHLLGIWLAVASLGGKRASRAPLPLRLFRESYPLILIPLFWLELDPLIRSVHGSTWDATIIALDRAVFGFNLDRVWIRAMPQRWFSEIMNFSYWIYLPLIFLPAILFAGRRDEVAFRDTVLRLMVTYLACYTFYMIMPTAGPKVFGLPYDTPAAGGFFYELVARAHDSGNVYGAAFPSSHVAGAVTVAWIAWRWFPGPIGWMLSLQALGVMMSTVYTQNHYAIDSLAGVVLALTVQGLVVPALRGETRRAITRPVRESLPPLAAPPVARGAS